MTQLELYYGVFRSNQKDKNLQLLQSFLNQFTLIPLDEESAKIAGIIKADLARIGTPIGPYDVEIAAIALANDLILVTHNTREFSRVNGLKIEDWESET
ncbi:PIN domain-containing protein (plasmid) [Anabaena sp. PCC 7938]|uniref:PIN domain-containing protein n=1 Tax=Anabaena TaxID=1163 RepID=UPI0020341C3F|nr:PIN domain-containing protein [Anabaena sp. CCAP 1446/1C]MCM2409298.1 PIN domain-containing protein [Anabaena sp. CCAP 1446/1C]